MFLGFIFDNSKASPKTILGLHLPLLRDTRERPTPKGITLHITWDTLTKIIDTMTHPKFRPQFPEATKIAALMIIAFGEWHLQGDKTN